jgi:hypothetical protein
MYRVVGEDYVKSVDKQKEKLALQRAIKDHSQQNVAAEP